MGNWKQYKDMKTIKYSFEIIENSSNLDVNSYST